MNIKKLERLGRRWTNYGKDRIYLNNLNELGKLSKWIDGYAARKARLNGTEISKNDYNRYDCSNGKMWFNVQTCEFEQDGYISPKMFEIISENVSELCADDVQVIETPVEIDGDIRAISTQYTNKMTIADTKIIEWESKETHNESDVNCILSIGSVSVKQYGTRRNTHKLFTYSDGSQIIVHISHVFTDDITIEYLTEYKYQYDFIKNKIRDRIAAFN